MKKLLMFPPLCAAILVSACADQPAPIEPKSRNSVVPLAANRDAGERYVAIGTSISMGWASNGVYFASQQVAWPALLAFGTGHPITLPLIQSPGCTSPIVAPLAAGKRLSGEPLSGSTVCAPNVAGVVLPTQNVGIASALALDAVRTTPETAPVDQPWYARVLSPGTTQLTAALSQRPTVVSVELGGNEILGTLSGLVLAGVTYVPLPYFTQPVDAILNAIGQTHAEVLVVGMPKDGTNLPALRRGDEIWADRAEFAALHVDVSSDCNGSQNWINVAIKSLNEVFTAAYTSTHGLPNPVFSCADIPGTPDLVLTPDDITFLNGFLAQMNAHTRAQAEARGYAFTTIGALYDLPNIKGGSYSVIKQLTSPAPYGSFVTLDGIHPSPLGQAILASAAARAFNKTYGENLAQSRAMENIVAATAHEVPASAERALELARKVANEHAGEQLPACPMVGNCSLNMKGLR